MTERLSLRYTVALLGFSDFERGTLASFFRLAEDRTPSYTEAKRLEEADFIVGNADQAAAVTTVQQSDRTPDTVWIGSNFPVGAIACLRRPIAPTHIVRELDLLLEQRLATLDTPVEPDWVSSGPAHRGGADDARTARDVLVVDDSRVALRFMQVRLQKRGYRVHVALTAEEALERLAAQSFAMVFLDVALGPHASMDGLALCQRIKQGRQAVVDGIPQVLLVTGLASSSDRVRGELAGCDAYLTKPLMDADLDQALNLLDPIPTAS